MTRQAVLPESRAAIADRRPIGREAAAARKASGIGWFIEEPLLARLAALYELHIGPLDRLLTGLEGAPDRKDLLAIDPVRAAAPKLRHARALMVSDLAKLLNRNDGRDAFGPRDWRVLIYVVLGAGTLRYALSRLGECLEAMNGRLGHMSLRLEGPLAFVRIDSARAEPSILGCAVDLYGIARMHGLFGTLIDRPIPITELALDCPSDLFAELRLPDMPPEFRLGAGWTGFAFPSTYLDYPLLCSEERISDWTRHSFMGTPSRAWSDANLSDRIRSMILSSLRDHGRLPSLPEVAGHFTVSPATIRRRLAADGASFREMRDSCRREIALRLLQQDELSIEVIAERLDYCDSDAFRSAFKVWMGLSPTEYRRSRENGAARRPDIV